MTLATVNSSPFVPPLRVEPFHFNHSRETPLIQSFLFHLSFYSRPLSFPLIILPFSETALPPLALLQWLYRDHTAGLVMPPSDSFRERKFSIKWYGTAGWGLIEIKVADGPGRRDGVGASHEHTHRHTDTHSIESQQSVYRVNKRGSSNKLKWASGRLT